MNQQPNINEDSEYCIPTIVNGVTNGNPTSVTVQKHSDLMKTRINNLRESINVHNKEKCSLSKKHRVILIGDSNLKGYACNIQSLLSDNYTLYSIVKPGSTTSELKESAKEEVSQLSHDDVIIICSGTNDFEPNKFAVTFHNIMNFVKNNDHTNIILLRVPFRYDRPNSISVNRNISVLNRKLQKLVKAFPHTSFLKTDKNRNLSTNHGLHLNKLGKKLVQHQIASLLHSIFKQKSSHPIILEWQGIQDDNNRTRDGIQDDNNQTCDGIQDNNQTCDGIQDDNNQTCNGKQNDNQTCDGIQALTSNRNTSHKSKLPVTRSNDFLW
jgi:hypothetical protein